jgi:hypothetical protein
MIALCIQLWQDNLSHMSVNEQVYLPLRSHKYLYTISSNMTPLFRDEKLGFPIPPFFN